jgi:hypothetical protein
MLANKLCDTNGPSTIAGLRTALPHLDLKEAAYQPCTRSWNSFATFLTAYAGVHYLAIEIANGQALFDSISKKGENARNLEFHFRGRT